jgi:hypothetical protein
MATDGVKSSPKGLTPENILSNFQALRKEQLQISNKISEMEFDLHEHK